ncbi:hypothetical protein EVC23_011 [Rhizobium phage RHph_N3_8]|uniref:hypothetical protein n=1 Tax=Rhizobium phage RHph_N3_8 TaxID=2509748 RepID=UPI001AFAFB56|nr:hypothetical protein QEJ65_gp11 [Rhizobium phage RHph_N3_8]QIG76010.1 hypothetical protein EVC23_011 [Rhizobium phage RHph_N3_8]
MKGVSTMAFKDVINSARNPGEGEEVSPTIYDDLEAEYNNEKASAEAMIQKLAKEKAEAEAKLLEAQAHNYELMASLPITGNVPDVNGTTELADNPDAVSLADIITYE